MRMNTYDCCPPPLHVANQLCLARGLVVFIAAAVVVITAIIGVGVGAEALRSCIGVVTVRTQDCVW